MNRIKVMINGLPGNMACNVVRHTLDDDRFEVIPFSLTGPEITETETTVDNLSIGLIQPADRDRAIMAVIEKEGKFLSVDYTHPSAVNSNSQFFCKHHLPFVMGTTGGDRKALEDTVRASSVSAVIAPNMAKQIVGFQAMMEYASLTFPDLFKDYALKIKESHQKGKADTSGTAKAMVRYFNDLGIRFAEGDIIKERDPDAQKNVWCIPDVYLAGHGWHTYSLDSNDGTVHFEFTHNVNGRDVYAAGTLDALEYLNKKIKENIKGKVFTMIDVLKGV